MTQSRRALALLLAIPLVAAGCSGSSSNHPSGGAGRPATQAPFAYDASAPLDVTEEPVARTDTYVATKVTYRAQGETVPAYLTLPTNGVSPYPCIVIQYGFGGTKEDARSLWTDMASAGFGTFAIDARLHGERGTKRQLEAAGRTARGVRSILQGTVVDLRRALDYLSRRRGCDPHRLGYFGLSMGAFLGAMLAGVDSRVRATVLMVGGGDWRTFLRQTQGLESQGLGIARVRRDRASLDAAVAELDPIDPVHWVGRISPRPVLMLNGDVDTIVPPDSARALHAAAREPKDVVWFHGGHLAQGTEFLKTVVVIYAWLVLKLEIEAAVGPPSTPSSVSGRGT